VNFTLYIEGGRKSTRNDCKLAFIQLFNKCNITLDPTKVIAMGPRGDVWNAFQIQHHESQNPDLTLMLIDSEEPVKDKNETWKHLKRSDKWSKPKGCDDNQVLLMTISMETWLLAGLRLTAVTEGLERETKKNVVKELESLMGRDYEKNYQSFQLLSKIDPAKLEPLPSFSRVRRILSDKLK
jgi:hypothetical protein